MSPRPTTKDPPKNDFCVHSNLPYRRWVLYIFCFVAVSAVTGIVYGWPALRKQLQDDGSTLDESTLGAIFTVGAWSTQGGRFFVGLARDRFGTRWVVVVCTISVALGSLGVAWSEPNNAPALAVSLFFMGLGSGVQLCVQPVAGLFPNTTGTALASLSGAFQISGLVFLALTAGDSQGTRKLRFSAFAVLDVVLCAVAIVLLPKGKSFLLEEGRAETDPIEDGDSNRGRNDDSESMSAGAGGDALESKTHLETSGEKDVEGDDKTVTRGAVGTNDVCCTSKPSTIPAFEERTPSAVFPTVFEQIKDPEYILLCTWFSVCLIPLQYYVGSIGFQLEAKGDDDGFYSDLFSILYASAIIFSPAGGFLSDKMSLGVTQALATWMCAASLFILASDVALPMQAVGMLLYGVGRLLVFGMYFANCGKRFGYNNFGTLAGLGLLGSAIFSLLQYPMISGAANGAAQMINVGSGIALIAMTPYFVWLHRREKRPLS